LTTATAQQLADELRYLADETNFIVPYTMANAIEDFAETLTVYHFLVKHDKADRRRVYDQNLTQVAPETRRCSTTTTSASSQASRQAEGQALQLCRSRIRR